MAEISQKHIYDNGIKEFTVTKEIKRNDCACACTCVPDGLPFGSLAPPPPAPDNTAPQKFVITKQFKDNLCSCSCTCSPKEAASTSVATLITTIAAVASASPPSPVKSMVTAVEDIPSVASTGSTATSSVPSETTVAADSRRVPEDNLKKGGVNFEESNDDKPVTARPDPDKQASLARVKPVATRPVSTAPANDSTDASSSTEPLESATRIPVALSEGSESRGPESRSSSTATPGRETSALQPLSSRAPAGTTANDERTYASTATMPSTRPSESSASTSSQTLPAVGSIKPSISEKVSDETVNESEATTRQVIETSAEEDDRMTEAVNDLPTMAIAANVLHLATTAADDTSRKADVPAATISPASTAEAATVSSQSSQKPTDKGDPATKATRTQKSSTTESVPTPNKQNHSSSTSTAGSENTEASQAPTAHGSSAESAATTKQGMETSSEEDDRMTGLVNDFATTKAITDVMHIASTPTDDTTRNSDVSVASISSAGTAEAAIASSPSSQEPIDNGNLSVEATGTRESGTIAGGFTTLDQQTHSSDLTSVSTGAPNATQGIMTPTAHESSATVGSALLNTTETSTASDIEESNLDEIATEIEQTADLVTTSAPGDSIPNEQKETTSGEHAKAAEEFKSKAMDLLTRLRETVARARVNLQPDNITTSRQDLTTLAAERTTKSEPTIGATSTDLRATAPSSDELAETTSVPPSADGRESEFRTKAASLLERLQKKLDDLRSKAKASAANTSTAQSVSPVESVTEEDASTTTRVHLSSSEPSSSQTTVADGPLASSATSETTKVFVATSSSVASTTQQSTEAGDTWSTQGSTAILQEDSDVVTGTNVRFSKASTAATTAKSSLSVHGEQSTENLKDAATLNAQSTSTAPSTPSSSSEPTIAEDHWGSTTDTSTTEATLVTHEPFTPTPSATVHHPITTIEIPSATTPGLSLESTASLPSSRTDPGTETARTGTATEHLHQQASRVSAEGTTSEPTSSVETTAESSTSVSPTTAKVQSTTAKRPTQPSFAFVTAPPENGSLSTNAEVVQSITTHLLMTLSRALSTQTTTENSREASTKAESDIEHMLESVLSRDSQSTANTSASTGNSFVQGIGNGGTTVPIRTSERIQQEQPTTAGNGNDVQAAPDSAPAETQFDSQSTSADVASAIDGDVLTLDKVETPVLGVKDAKDGRDSDSSNVFMPTRFEIPSSRILEERLEQARRLREEQRRLEMLASIQKEANFQSQQDRRREIEEKLAQLAESERWHRELLQRARLQQRIMANGGDETKLPEDKGNEVGSETNSQYPNSRMVTPLPTTIATATSNDASDRCAPVQRFVQVFHVKDPHQWLRENCVFIKQYFPAASCLQIQTLLATCFANIAPTTESPAAASS